MKILAVDDIPDNVELLRQILKEEAEYDVITAYNGADCLTKAKEQQPDLIMLDVQMPGMTGYEALEKLKEDAATEKIPVIFLTARYRDTDRVVRGFELGAFDYITKPVEDDVLLAKVKVIARIKQAEDQLKAALQEKEVLLQEVYHRTKNNMAAICSLLQLQSDHIEDEQVLHIFQETENRILSMTLVQQKLYQSDDLANIDLKEYLMDLADTVFENYQMRSGNIALTFDIESPVIVSNDTAIPCGLILNELLSNAMKYAFPDDATTLSDQTHQISVSLYAMDAGEIELRVRDNGVGLPDDFDLRNSPSLGLELVTMFAESQLQGTLELKSAQGAEFIIRFKESVKR